MKKFIFLIFFLCFFSLANAAEEEIKLVIRNGAGYPIHHLSISRIEEEPTLDILEKPLQSGESIDIFLKKSQSKNLILWLFNEDFSRIAIELGTSLDMIQYIEIQNDGSVKFIKYSDNDFLRKNK